MAVELQRESRTRSAGRAGGRAAEENLRRRFGVDGRGPTRDGPGASRALAVLGPEMFAEVKAARVGGRLVWCNFEVARALGFSVPASNRMTPELHAQLVDAISYRALGRGEDEGGRETAMLYADKYGGAGVRPALGSARSAFLPYGNLLLKGVGFTPLYKHDDDVEDFAHSTGAMPVAEGLFEAVFGEVNANLFTRGTTRILALVDQGRTLVYPKVGERLCAVAARAGSQLRPGHLLAHGVRRRGVRNLRMKLFLAITRETGQLVTRGGTPDVRATMLRVLDDHALTAAELFRWRMLHGALSPSNMEMSGAMLDLATQTSQPRTAPVYVLKYENSVFGREHVERALQLREMYRALLRGTPPPQRRTLNASSLDITRELAECYGKHLRPVLLRAAGLKPEVAGRVADGSPLVAARFADLLTRMTALRNPGSMKVSRSRPLPEGASVLDVFNLLRVFPAKYFGGPKGVRHRAALAALRPVYKGGAAQRAKKRDAARALAAEFVDAYDEVMETAGALAGEFYGGARNLRASVAARAAFENRPFTELYFPKLFRELRAAEAAYKATGDADAFAESVDRRVTVSLRNVEALLARGGAGRARGGGFEVEARTIAGVSYCVRAWDDARQRRRLRVSLPLRREGGRYSVPLLGLDGLSRGQLRSLRCLYAAGGHAGEAAARLEEDGRAAPVLSFEIACRPYLVGELEVTFRRVGSHAGQRFGGYTFAVPDRQELLKLLQNFQRPRADGRRPRGRKVSQR